MPAQPNTTHRRRRRVRISLVAGLAVLGGITACTPSEEPSTLPSARQHPTFVPVKPAPGGPSEKPQQSEHHGGEKSAPGHGASAPTNLTQVDRQIAALLQQRRELAGQANPSDEQAVIEQYRQKLGPQGEQLARQVIELSRQQPPR